MTRSASRRARALLAVVCASLCAPLQSPALHAQQWGVAARHFVGWGGPRTRAGDIQGYGASVRRALGGPSGGRWEIALAADRFEYDLETPVHATGVQPRAGDLAVDAFTMVTRAQVDLIRRFRLRPGARWTPLAFGGAGVYWIDVPDVSGNVEGGGTFRLTTESPTTGGVTLGLGSEWRLVGGLSATLGFSYSQTFARYGVTELGTGARGTISPFSPLGLGTQLVYRW